MRKESERKMANVREKVLEVFSDPKVGFVVEWKKFVRAREFAHLMRTITFTRRQQKKMHWLKMQQEKENKNGK